MSWFDVRPEVSGLLAFFIINEIFRMKDFGHLNYGINPKVPAERSVEWVNSLDGHGNEDVTAITYKSYSQKAQNKRFVCGPTIYQRLSEL